MKETARNILKRNFDTEKLNEKWVSDITYIWTRKDEWCYLSSIMDLHGRIHSKIGFISPNEYEESIKRKQRNCLKIV
ncbi:integrase core domain protein [Leptotrichia hongkongensis]|uniref:Integrase core domain protein n=1 Tax=Leptotrichia hongkongensis TaxID=554406 RepID=A0A510L6G5_9FUSO|nr:integrase core domain protein [Leptotrichia hongkongensis]